MPSSPFYQTNKTLDQWKVLFCNWMFFFTSSLFHCFFFIFPCYIIEKSLFLFYHYSIYYFLSISQWYSYFQSVNSAINILHKYLKVIWQNEMNFHLLKIGFQSFMKFNHISSSLLYVFYSNFTLKLDYRANLET